MILRFFPFIIFRYFQNKRHNGVDIICRLCKFDAVGSRLTFQVGEFCIFVTTDEAEAASELIDESDK
jgi:hypothetical protein